MRRVFFSRGLALLALCTGTASAQDERRVASPDGNIEFRLFIAGQETTPLFRIAYEIRYRGKPLIDRSFLGFDIWDQEPLLGETTGLTSEATYSGPVYNALTANFLQNGSLGRRLTIETRVYNDGVAFRYLIPRSIMLDKLLIADEATEFAFPRNVTAPESGPFAAEELGVWIAISELPSPNHYPPMHLANFEPSVLLTRLPRLPSDPKFAFEGKAPFTGPWRIVGIAPEQDRALHPGFLRSLPN